MAQWTQMREDIDIDASFQLVFGYLPSPKHISGNRVKCNATVASALREACRETVRRLDSRAPLEMSPDIVTVDNPYITVPTGTEFDPLVTDFLRNHHDLAYLSLADAKKVAPTFYAVVCDGGDHRWSAFISRHNPHTMSAGRRWFTFEHDTLTDVTYPLFQFATAFEMIALSSDFAVLSQNAFELLFRNITAMRERYPVWVESLSVPLGLTAPQARLLEERCSRYPSVAVHLRRIFEGKVPVGLTAASLKRAMRNQKFDVERYFAGNQLTIKDLQANELVKLLKFVNEDFYLGPLSKAPYEAIGKIGRP